VQREDRRADPRRAAPRRGSLAQEQRQKFEDDERGGGVQGDVGAVEDPRIELDPGRIRLIDPTGPRQRGPERVRQRHVQPVLPRRQSRQ
jgi:hypothetical protein